MKELPMPNYYLIQLQVHPKRLKLFSSILIAMHKYLLLHPLEGNQPSFPFIVILMKLKVLVLLVVIISFQSNMLKERFIGKNRGRLILWKMRGLVESCHYHQNVAQNQETWQLLLLHKLWKMILTSTNHPVLLGKRKNNSYIILLHFLL